MAVSGAAGTPAVAVATFGWWRRGLPSCFFFLPSCDAGFSFAVSAVLCTAGLELVLAGVLLAVFGSVGNGVVAREAR